jgi:hypothetical protein
MCYTYEEIKEEVSDKIRKIWEEIDKLEDDRERDLFIFQEFLTALDAVEHRFVEREEYRNIVRARLASIISPAT